MADDKGNASKICKKTRRVMLGNVRVKDGQHLHYFISAAGSTPIFVLACEHKTHFDSKELGPPRKLYDVVWQRSSADAPGADGDTYTFAMSFAGVDKYTLRVELHNANHLLVDDRVIVDADYDGSPASTLCNESFVVRT
jgi:hypothetical protein